MDCKKAQELILESLAETQVAEDMPDLNTHLAGCDTCRSFSEVQGRLDAGLGEVIVAPSLSPAFRASLMKAVRREPLSVWPESLPDVAHLAGGVFATVLCAPLLPFSVSEVMLGGLGFTLVTYLLQTVIRGSLET
jgi:hypothetical protein